MKAMSLNLKNTHYLKFLFLSILIVVSGCKKIEDLSSKPDFQANFTTTSPSSISPNLTNNLLQNSYNAYSHLSQIEGQIMSASAWLNIVQYMPGLQEENGNSSRMPSPAPQTWTWSFPPLTITFIYNQTSTQYVYSYTIDNNGCLYYNMNGWENINGSEGHWEQTIDPSCAPGGNPTGLSLYLQTLDWQYSSGEYDVQFTQDFGTIPNVLSKHFDYTINQNGTGNYYMYSFTSPALFTCPPAPASAHPSSTGLSLEYECQWWNNGAAGTFINYQTGQTTTWP